MNGRGNQIGFGPPYTPPVIKNLMIANAVVFVASVFSSDGMSDPVTSFGAVVPYEVWQKGHFWEPFTYMWLHGSVMHIVFNMFALWMFGVHLENPWGSRRFAIYYLTCVMGAGLVQLVVVSIHQGPIAPTLGASGGVFGVLLAFGMMYPTTDEEKLRAKIAKQKHELAKAEAALAALNAA